MALANVLVPNNYALFEGTTFTPIFTPLEGTPNTYTDLGSMYIRSNSGRQIFVISKFSILSNAAANASFNVTLPVSAPASLAGTVVLTPTAIALNDGSAPGISILNIPASNSASTIRLGTAGLANGATYIALIMYSYSV